MRIPLHIITSMLVLIFVNTVEAQPKWEIDDVIMTTYPSDMQLTEKCDAVAWVKNTPDKRLNRVVSHIVYKRLSSKEAPIRLTRGDHDCTSPRWSKDGQSIAFLTDRPVPKTRDDSNKANGSQIWRIPPDGGEAEPLTAFPSAIQSFAWETDDSILFSAEEPGEKQAEDGVEVLQGEPTAPPVRLYRFHLKTGKVTQVTDNKDWIEWFSVSPDGKYVITHHNRSLTYIYDQEIRPQVILSGLNEKKKPINLSDKLTGKPGALAIQQIYWTPDGKGFYIVSAYTSHPKFVIATIMKVHYFDVETETLRPVDLQWDNGLAVGIDEVQGILQQRDMFAVTKDGFIALLADGVNNTLAKYKLDAKEWVWSKDTVNPISANRNFIGLRTGKDGVTVISALSSAMSPTTWYHSRLVGKNLIGTNPLTRLGTDLQNKQIAKTEVIPWKWKNGTRVEEVEGLLHYPHNYDENDEKEYPLVVMIHGGPTEAVWDRWEENWNTSPNLLCARGAFVLRPNYHGSTNYGLEWVESLTNGRYYDLPAHDIEHGILHIINEKKYKVDSNKVALTGWSNGAILTMDLITRKPKEFRYAAAVAGAGGSEWSVDWGIGEYSLAFLEYYFGKSPFEDVQLYQKNAPYYRLKNAKDIPVLFTHGKLDTVVPAFHAITQYNALRRVGNKNVRLVYFPGENHTLEKLSHRARRVQEELDWFDRYLFQAKKKQ